MVHMKLQILIQEMLQLSKSKTKALCMINSRSVVHSGLVVSLYSFYIDDMSSNLAGANSSPDATIPCITLFVRM